MSGESYFIAKTDVGDLDLIEVGGVPAIENFEALRDVLRRRAGPDLADIFAEPIYRRGNGEAPAVVSWYAPVSDTARRLASLEPEDRVAAEAMLRSRLAKVARAMGDPAFGPLVGAALHIRSLDDVYVLGARPIVANWGVVPKGVAARPEARYTHYSSTLGRFLPLGMPPPISAPEMQDIAGASVADPQPASEAGTAEPFASAPATGGGVPPPVPPSGGDGEGGRPRGFGWRWVPLVALLLLTGAALIFVSIPGVLLYPDIPGIDEGALARIADESNDALRQRRDELQGALDGAVCSAEGELRFPTLTLPRLDDVEGGNDSGTRGRTEALRPDDLLPLSPERVIVPKGGSDGGPQDLLTHIENRTAMVLVEFENSLGSGSGFFISPELFVTNDHVIYGSKADQKELGQPRAIWVKNERLGRGVPAEIIGASGQPEKFGRDLALLRVPGANAEFFDVWGSTDSIKLQNVIAAGFPAAYLQIDQARKAMYDPGRPEMPDMIMTSGTVNAQQTVGEEGTLAVVHSADISSGNSGGPLIDQCGRVVGINTFGIRDEVTQRFLNFSLHTQELIDFVGPRSTDLRQTAERCRPEVRPPDDVARAEPAQQPEGEPPGPQVGPPEDAATPAPGDAGPDQGN